MAKSTISMAIFNSFLRFFVCSPEGETHQYPIVGKIPISITMTIPGTRSYLWIVAFFFGKFDENPVDEMGYTIFRQSQVS